MNRRGYSLLAVLLVLALVGVAIGTGARILSAHVRSVRTHFEAQYAVELARSGLAWGEAHVHGDRSDVARTLAFRGGEARVEVATVPGGFRIVARGRALVGRRVSCERTESEFVPGPAHAGR